MLFLSVYSFHGHSLAARNTLVLLWQALKEVVSSAEDAYIVVLEKSAPRC